MATHPAADSFGTVAPFIRRSERRTSHPADSRQRLNAKHSSTVAYYQREQHAYPYDVRPGAVGPSNLLHVLTADIFPVPNEYPLLQPIWAAEAMHRAINMRSLIERYEGRQIGRPYRPICQSLELVLAKNLSALLTSLTLSAEPTYVPCADTLYWVVTSLFGLFSSSSEESLTVAKMARLRLRSDRRRALILAAAELVTGLLLANVDCGLPLHIGVALRRWATTAAS